jgi:hypothetical protein
MAVEIDTTEFDALLVLFHHRAENMVPEAVDEGRQRADGYAAAGGRQNRTNARFLRRNERPVLRAKQATASQTARMTERVLYQKFIDFWGSW